jgi:hypothetical protein
MLTNYSWRLNSSSVSSAVRVAAWIDASRLETAGLTVDGAVESWGAALAK